MISIIKWFCCWWNLPITDVSANEEADSENGWRLLNYYHIQIIEEAQCLLMKWIYLYSLIAKFSVSFASVIAKTQRKSNNSVSFFNRSKQIQYFPFYNYQEDTHIVLGFSFSVQYNLVCFLHFILMLPYSLAFPFNCNLASNLDLLLNLQWLVNFIIFVIMSHVILLDSLNNRLTFPVSSKYYQCINAVSQDQP